MSNPNPGASGGPLVLIVDDCADTREMYSAFLELEGYRTACEGTGTRALAAAFAERPDIVIMDLTLPEMDGREATTRLKEDSRTADVPVIVLSGHAHDEPPGTPSSPWDAYLTKPCLPEELVACVKAILEGKSSVM
jgi:CheY-like chemotaxis protein